MNQIVGVPLGALTFVVICAASAMGWGLVQGPGSGGSILNGVFTTAQAERGRRQFQQACISCHTVAEHTGARFVTRWQGSTLGDLFELISTTMPQSDPGSLPAEDYASILAFFLGESGYRDGETALPSEIEPLKAIRIEAPAK